MTVKSDNRNEKLDRQRGQRIKNEEFSFQLVAKTEMENCREQYKIRGLFQKVWKLGDRCLTEKKETEAEEKRKLAVFF